MKQVIKTVLFLLIGSFVGILPTKGQSPTKGNSYSVVQDSRTEIICKSPTEAVEKHSITLKILDTKGLSEAMFVCGCDVFRELQKFSGELFDSTGKSVRKIKKTELQRTEYNSALKTDDYLFYYECKYPTFPFTIKYEWEIKCKNGLIEYPAFRPIKDFQQSVEKASYRLELPVGQTCKYKVLNDEKKNIQITESKGKEGQAIIEATIANLPYIEEEPYSLPRSQLFPIVFFVPSDFVYDGTMGNMETWKNFGMWQYSLLEGRDQLTEPFKQKLHELTATCKNDKEKVKAVYDYLAATTRYVSIQLGIGGLQPTPASEVCRLGFGDCKGLSNYTRAMLKELGIPSTYTVISNENPKLLKDFASVSQMNHAILQVPLPQDTLWLECTCPQLPFGYVHHDIAGHNAILIGPEGGKLCQLPTYNDSLNTQKITATVEISPSGQAKIQAVVKCKLLQYENSCGIKELEPSKQKDALREEINLNQADIQNIQIEENKSSHPEICIKYTVTTQQYGNKTGNRLFIPANVFRKSFVVPGVTERKQPICFNYGYNDTDTVRIKLPEGYSIEGLTKPVTINTKFGNFYSSVEVKNKEILVVNHLHMRKGIYKPEDYSDFINFRKQIASHYNGKIILKKD